MSEYYTLQTIKEINFIPSFLIPKTLIDNKKYSSMEIASKLIYGIILDSNMQDFYLTLEDISKIINSSKNTTSQYISCLLKMDLVHELTDLEKYTILNSKNLNGFGIGKNVCEWCGINTTYLHEHHYPIKKSQGGISVVNICPTCHLEFHNRLFSALPLPESDGDING